MSVLVCPNPKHFLIRRRDTTSLILTASESTRKSICSVDGAAPHYTCQYSIVCARISSAHDPVTRSDSSCNCVFPSLVQRTMCDTTSTTQKELHAHLIWWWFVSGNDVKSLRRRGRCIATPSSYRTQRKTFLKQDLSWRDRERKSKQEVAVMNSQYI